MIVDNKPGGNGNIGTVAVARAPADGHTLLVQYSGYHVGNPWLQANVPWKGSDFAPVALAIRAPQVVVVPVSLPVKTLKEFVDYAKRTPARSITPRRATVRSSTSPARCSTRRAAST